MKRKIALPVALLVLGALIGILALVSEDDTVRGPVLQEGPVSEEEVAAAPPLCEAARQPVLEFESIDVAYTQIKRHSIFREKAEDPSFLSQEMVTRTFQFLSRPVPGWAHEILQEEQGADEFRPGTLSRRLYEELIAHTEYESFRAVTGKNTYITASINALIKAIDDPFAYYYAPEDWIAAGGTDRHLGSYKGMGITLSKNERGEVVIQSVFSGSPAERAGLQIGDAIVLFNEKKVDSCSVTQLSGLIKQLDEETISLVLRRRGKETLERIHMSLERVQLLELSTCPAFALPEGRGDTSKGVRYFCPLRDRNKNPQERILYISLKGFSPQASQDLYTVLSAVDFAAVSGIIIDVRHNPGGLLNAVSDILDYFLTKDDVLYREERTAYNPFLDKTTVVTSSYRQDRYNIVPRDIPVVVLVGRGTFSAAELFAGAMQDHKRALLMGSDERTGGKGTVNFNIELAKDGPSQGAIYIAIGFWKTPEGRNIQLWDRDKDGYEEVGGLNPDIRVELEDEDYINMEADPAWYDPVIFAAIEYLNKKK